MARIALSLPVPPSINHAYRPGSKRDARGARFKTDTVKRFERDAMWAILAASSDRKRPVEERVNLHKDLVPPIFMEAWLYLATKRRADLDNRLKVMIDTIAKAFGFDDSLITDLLLHKRHDAQNPRCEVLLIDDASEIVPTFIKEAS